MIGDTVYEFDEQFILDLTGATGAVLSLSNVENRHVFNVVNDDIPALPDNFNGLDYLASYGDLAAAFGTDERAAALHYSPTARAE